MADISMCDGVFDNGVCDLRMKCYRHMANADPKYQSYIDATTCRYHNYDLFWPITKGK